MANPIFDIDDLSFFRDLGLALRHVGLEQGLKEAKEGAERGDVYSLARYGLDASFTWIDVMPYFPNDTCEKFQEKLEDCIFTCFTDYHHPAQRYQDAAFLLLNRGGVAKNAVWDLDKHPLGKTGRTALDKNSIYFIITSDKWEHDDANHAAYNICMELKNKLRAFKIQKAQSLISEIQQSALTVSQQKYLIDSLDTLLGLYRKNIRIDSPLFARISDLLNLSKKQEIKDHYLEPINEMMRKLQNSAVKGETPLRINYQPLDFNALSLDQLIAKVAYFIEQQHLPHVQACLSRIPPTAIADKHLNWIGMAAALPSKDILEAVYNYMPSAYNDEQVRAEYPRPIFLAGRSGHTENIRFLLSKQALTAEDQQWEGKHILSYHKDSLIKVEFIFIKFCIDQHMDIGNFDAKMNTNPLAYRLFQACEKSQEEADKILDLMLPLANAQSKYLAILRTTDEMVLIHNSNLRFGTSLSGNAFAANRNIRNKLFASLTEAECQEIKKLHAQAEFNPCEGKDHLIKDMLGVELKQAQKLGNTALEQNIQLSLGSLKKKEEQRDLSSLKPFGGNH